MIDTEKIKTLTYELIKALGENPNRDGLKETPLRISKMYKEICAGLENKTDDLIKLFKEEKIKKSGQSEIIEINDIPIYSLCEHHFLPFFGTANIKYVPKNGIIMGLSKFARVVDYFSKKPQTQERLTFEIAEFLYKNLDAKGVEVSLECQHMCMIMRGIKAHGSKTKTTFKCGDLNN